MPQLPASLVISQLPGAGAAQPASSLLAADGEAGLEGAQGLSFGALLGRQMKGIAALLGEGKDSSLLPGALVDKDEIAETVDGGVAPAIFTADFSAMSAMMVLVSPPPSEPPPTLDLPQVSVAPQSSDPLQASAVPQSPVAPQPSVVAQSPAAPQSPVVPQVSPVSQHSANPLAASARSDGAAGRPSAEAGAAMPKLGASSAGGAHPAAEIAANGKNLPQTSPAEDSFAHKLAALADGAAGKIEQQAPLSDLHASVRHPAAAGADAAMALRQPGPLPALSVAPRVGAAEWGGAVGEKMVWMANQNHQVAELHLNPPNLGPLEVRLTISNDQASALFVSQHSAVRDAIETALPRLREMLADNGIMLGNASVGSESFSQQQQAFEQHGGGREGRRTVGAMDDVAGRLVGNAAPLGLSRDGMVDIFA